MPIINKRWDGSRFRSGATFRRWNGSTWKTGATVRVWTGSDWIPSLKLEITGGTIYTRGLYTYHVFTNTGATHITVKGKGEIEWLIAAGGGGGGIGNGYSITRVWEICGGGAGTLNVLAGSTYTLTPGSYTVYVGAGGQAGGGKGGDSYISDIPTAYSRGGGSGESGQRGTETGIPSTIGGSGGGAGNLPRSAYNKNPRHPNGQTFANGGGQTIKSGNYRYSGNGGGAGSAGTPSNNNSINGLVPPGNWYMSNGQPVGLLCSGGIGGIEWAGDGPSNGATTRGVIGPNNTGNGGGGTYRGGSGIVYIRYKTLG